MMTQSLEGLDINTKQVYNLYKETIMQNNNERFVELLNEIKKITDEIEISYLDISEDDKELLCHGLNQTKCFIENGKLIIANKK